MPIPPRPLGRDTRTTVRHFDKLIKEIPAAPRSFGGAAVPRRSPNLRRFHHGFFQDQRNRGLCVGFNGNATIMSQLRVPPSINDDALLLSPILLSALYHYDISRQQAKLDGIELGNEDGSIASCGARAAQRRGVALVEDEPESDAEVDGHPNDAPPPQTAVDYGTTHLVKTIALAETWERGLELNAAGYFLEVACDIPEGMFNTLPSGICHLTGAIAGGHDWQVIDHDLDADLLIFGQSWKDYGEYLPADPRYDDATHEGYSQIGMCSLTDAAKLFTPRLMSSGASEIVCYSKIDGFPPLLDFNFEGRPA